MHSSWTPFRSLAAKSRARCADQGQISATVQNIIMASHEPAADGSCCQNHGKQPIDAASQVRINPHPKVVAIEAEMIKNRRFFHQHPELSFEEHNTAAYVAEQLRAYGSIEVTTGVGRTGVVGVIRGSKPGPCIALRADMDALPITETTDLPFKSVNPGVMHACGHDGHIAMLLGAAKVLVTMREQMRGIVKLIFQPAEEGKGGALEMVKDGVLEKEPKVDQVYGLHLWNYQPVGSVSTKYGPLFAASDYFTIAVHGLGGHGAVPQGTKDAIVAAAQLVLSLHTIVSRNISPLDSAVVTVGQINGGYNYNIIADRVDLTGTVRTLLPNTRALVQKRMQEICSGVGTMFGMNVELNYHQGYPCTVNHSKEHVDKLIASASKVVGADKTTMSEPTMAAEDFSYFLNERPGCFFLLGSSPTADLGLHPHHKSTFTIHEDALVIGASVFVQLIDDLLVVQKS